MLLTAGMSEADAYLRESLCGLYDDLTGRIERSDKRLLELADGNESVNRLMTHSGIGFRTALAVVATLGPPQRFSNLRQVTAFVGLDPLNDSSGEKQRIGRISKHGSRLCRYLLGQAAARSQDRSIKEAYSRIRSRRSTAVAKVAAARRLLVNCYVMLRDGIDYAEFTRRGEVGRHENTLASKY
jgi:transposase